MTTSSHDPKLRHVLFDDLRQGDFFQSLRYEYRDAKEFMLREERLKQLNDMNPFKRVLFISWWMVKGLVLKLTPFRRILLLIGVILLFSSRTVMYQDQNIRIENDTSVVGILCVLFVLMLELKDKLIAKKELEAGHAVQAALMPERAPDVPGWGVWLFSRPANEVCGDLIDYIKVQEQRYGIALGDVAGKGLRAALLSAKLQATMRAIVSDHSSLNGFAAKVNAIFCRDSLPNIFSSLIYLEVQPDEKFLRLVNAGHFPPLIIRETAIEKLERGGPALGILPNAEYREQRIELQSGDLLLIYSDGVTEARNEKGEFYGEHRFTDLLQQRRALSAQQLGETIVADVDTFCGSAKSSDDLSLVILKRL